MVTTSPDALFSPDAPSQYNLTVDLAAMQVSTQNALNNRVRHYTATAVGNLPTTGLSGNPSGFTTNDQREWRWTGTKWILVGGAIPFASVRLAADTTINTTYAGLNTQSGGIAVSGNFSVPAGCGGIYALDAFISVTAEAANVYLQPFVNSTATNKEVLSGGQRAFSLSTKHSLAAGDVVQWRARVFSGTGSLTAANTWFSMAYLGAN